jgi:hypothetical protein
VSAPNVSVYGKARALEAARKAELEAAECRTASPQLREEARREAERLERDEQVCLSIQDFVTALPLKK